MDKQYSVSKVRFIKWSQEIYPFGIEPLSAGENGRKNQKKRLVLADCSRIKTGADRCEEEKKNTEGGGRKVGGNPVKGSRGPLDRGGPIYTVRARAAFADRTVQGILRAVAGLSATPAIGSNHITFHAGMQHAEREKPLQIIPIILGTKVIPLKTLKMIMAVPVDSVIKLAENEVFRVRCAC